MNTEPRDVRMTFKTTKDHQRVIRDSVEISYMAVI